MSVPVIFRGHKNEVEFFSSSFDANRSDVREGLLRLFNQNDYARPSENILSRSLMCASVLEEYGFKEFEVFSGDEGEILISAFSGPLCFEVTIETNHQYTISVEINKKSVAFEERVGPARVAHHLSEALQKKWILSAGFALDGGAKKTAVGRVWPSRNRQVMTVGRVLWNIPAPSKRAAA